MPDLEPPSQSSTQPSGSPQPFEYELRRSGRAAVWIRVSGELDVASAPQFEPTLREALRSALLVVVDIRGLTFIDSTGLSVIVAAHGEARQSRRRLVLVRGPAPIDRLFELTGLSEQLEIVDLRPVLAPSPSPSARRVRPGITITKSG